MAALRLGKGLPCKSPRLFGSCMQCARRRRGGTCRAPGYLFRSRHSG